MCLQLMNFDLVVSKMSSKRLLLEKALRIAKRRHGEATRELWRRRIVSYGLFARSEKGLRPFLVSVLCVCVCVCVCSLQLE